MAFYIAWVKGLSRRREVLLIAKQLGISRREAACCCMEVWEWADDETTDGTILGVTPDVIDSVLNVPGFARAMMMSEVGWLVANDAGITFPRWSKNNVSSAKKREYERDKKRQQRNLRQKKCPRNVPKKNGDKDGDKTGTVPGSVSSLSLIPLPTLLKKKEFEIALEAWVEYKRSVRREEYKLAGLKAMVALAEKRATSYGLQAVIDAMEKAIAENWKGWDHESSFSSRVKGNGRNPSDPRGTMAAAQRYLDQKEFENAG